MNQKLHWRISTFFNPLIIGCWIRIKILHSGQKHIFSSLLRLRGENLSHYPTERRHRTLPTGSVQKYIVGLYNCACTKRQDSWILSNKNLKAGVIIKKENKNYLPVTTKKPQGKAGAATAPKISPSCLNSWGFVVSVKIPDLLTGK